MGHGHHHDHGAPAHGKAFAISVGLNVAFSAIEVVFGLLAGSMALLADAAHNLGDVLGLGLAWGATYLARLAPSEQRTYGWRKSTVLAALLNAVLILVAVGGVAWEAIERLSTPQPVDGWSVVVVAGIGVVINTLSAALFFRSRKHDVNIAGAFMHLAADAAVSAGVVVSGAVVLMSGWNVVDPATSLAVSVVIVIGTWGLLRQSVDLALDAVPSHIDLSRVKSCLQSFEDVHGLHDLHVWALSTSETALTVHLDVAPDCDSQALLERIGHTLEEQFDIHHTTIQLETTDGDSTCAQGRGGTV